MGWRDIKRQARFELHKHFQVQALYRAPGSTLWVKCRVRVHDTVKQLGGVKGVNYIYADREEMVPKIVFLASEVIPERGGIVSVEFDEAYILDHTEPRDNITITADAGRLEQRDIKGFPTPAACDPSLMCSPEGFEPKSQFGTWKGVVVGNTILFSDQIVQQFNAPYNAFTWADTQFLPYQLQEAYDFVIDIAGVSGIVGNDLSLTFGSYSSTLPLNNSVGVTSYKRFRGTIYATTSPVGIGFTTKGPFNATDIKISISPRTNRTQESMVVGKFNTTYLNYTLTRAYPEQVVAATPVAFDLSQGVVVTEIIGEGCAAKTWFTGANLSIDAGRLYDVQLRVNVTSQIVENSIDFDLGGSVVTRDLPAAAGSAADITVNWTTLMSAEKALSFTSKGPLQLNSAALELIPR